jgi:signal transduction histidine kinase
MSRKVALLLFSLFFFCAPFCAQQKSDIWQRAEAEAANGRNVSARSLFLRASKDYAAKGQMAQSVECGVKAAVLYYGENTYQEAFELLRDLDHNISQNSELKPSEVAALRYQVAKERMNMYLRMHRGERVLEQLEIMERHANASGDEAIGNDLLYNKAIYYYSFGQTARGNAVFQEMASKLMDSKEYDKMEDVYKTLIANGRKSGSASMVAQAYSGYIAWKDSVNALKAADETRALKEQIAAGEASIAERDNSMASRTRIIIGLCILLAILAGVLIVAALLLLRFIYLTRKQKKTIRMANENNALKAKFISNISAQLSPTLQRLDSLRPEVKALQDFAIHIQTLSDLETSMGQAVEKEEISLPAYCEGLIDQIRDRARMSVTLSIDTPKMSAEFNKEYVTYILLHLLRNATDFTPEGGHIWLDFKKRGAHKFQFIVSNTGPVIPEEMRENVFKPFLEMKDLTTGDGLGLPICRQMAVKMDGDLCIDPEFTKGTRFVLSLVS